MQAPKKPVLSQVKEEDRIRLGLEEGELNTRDLVKAQDDTKKKNYVKHYKWKYSFYNENNHKQLTDSSIVLKYD